MRETSEILNILSEEDKRFIAERTYVRASGLVYWPTYVKNRYVKATKGECESKEDIAAEMHSLFGRYA